MRSGTRNWRSTRGKWRRWVVVVVVEVDMVVVVVDLVVVEDLAVVQASQCAKLSVGHTTSLGFKLKIYKILNFTLKIKKTVPTGIEPVT